MNGNDALCLLADRLKTSRAPLIFGLHGISMENQRRCVRLARALSCCISTERLAFAESGLFTAGGANAADEPLTQNRAGACEVLLEEAGGLSARFTGGVPHADAIFAPDALLRANAIDCALLVGSCDALPAGFSGNVRVPLYVLGGADGAGAKAALLVPAAPFGQGEGGTALRSDGVPFAVPRGDASGLPALSALLDALLAEVSPC